MQVIGKVKRAGIEVEEAGMRIADVGKRIRQFTDDGHVDSNELFALRRMADTLAHEAFGLSSQSDVIEDVALDLKVGVRSIVHGRDRAINPHVKREIIDLDAVRREKALQKQTAPVAYDGPNDAA